MGPLPQVHKQVEQYRPLVQTYAEQYGVAAYEDVLLAIMMQESGGKGEDPMQALESYCGKIGCIDDPQAFYKTRSLLLCKRMELAEGNENLPSIPIILVRNLLRMSGSSLGFIRKGLRSIFLKKWMN